MKRGAGGGAVAPQSLSKLCEPPPPKKNNPSSTTFWIHGYAATCMCKQTEALQPHVGLPANLCV